MTKQERIGRLEGALAMALEHLDAAAVSIGIAIGLIKGEVE